MYSILRELNQEEQDAFDKIQQMAAETLNSGQSIHRNNGNGTNVFSPSSVSEADLDSLTDSVAKLEAGHKRPDPPVAEMDEVEVSDVIPKKMSERNNSNKDPELLIIKEVEKVTADSIPMEKTTGAACPAPPLVAVPTRIRRRRGYGFDLKEDPPITEEGQMKESVSEMTPEVEIFATPQADVELEPMEQPTSTGEGQMKEAVFGLGTLAEVEIFATPQAYVELEPLEQPASTGEGQKKETVFGTVTEVEIFATPQADVELEPMEQPASTGEGQKMEKQLGALETAQVLETSSGSVDQSGVPRKVIRRRKVLNQAPRTRIREYIPRRAKEDKIEVESMMIKVITMPPVRKIRKQPNAGKLDNKQARVAKGSGKAKAKAPRKRGRPSNQALQSQNQNPAPRIECPLCKKNLSIFSLNYHLKRTKRHADDWFDWKKDSESVLKTLADVKVKKREWVQSSKGGNQI